MAITVSDLLALTGAEPGRIEHLAELARRLKSVDEERANIIAALAEAGITEGQEAAPLMPSLHQEEAPPRRRVLNGCSECGEEATVNVDGLWYCAADDPTEK